MTERRRVAFGVGIIVAIFLFIQLSAIALVEPFEAAGYQPVENPEDPTNSLVYVGAILVATAFMLAAFKLNVDALIRLIIVASGAWLSLYVFRVLMRFVAPAPLADVVAIPFAIALGVALYVHPEWYVIDIAGAFMGAAAAGLFGIGFGVLPALILLTVLAVYDAISVYGTEHMLTLASGVMDLKVPVVLVIPMTADYSFLDADMPDPMADDADSAEQSAISESSVDAESGADGEPTTDFTRGGSDGQIDETEAADPLEREAMFIGLGDAVIPTVLVASAAFFAPESVPTLGGVALPALTAMVGTFAGLAVLLWMVMKGRAHAGLPLLNGGTIAGYVLGALVSGLTLVQALGLDAYL
ncbi:presenilin family intramembrane aspartyl protease [Halobacteria archaeon HArc-gm2]|nr:presenilin family intramembrane aspartyl protease [Halobacteria archaeon HArc-gm2]